MAYINGKRILEVVKTEFLPAVYQEKTITPQTFTPEVVADYGYAALSKVKLDGILVDPHESYTTDTDDTIAYQKNVPSGALSWANLSYVGGMSYKSENILPTNELGSGVSFSNDIMTITNSTGGMQILNQITLPAGTYVFSFIKLSELSSNHTFTLYKNNGNDNEELFNNFNNFTLNQVYTKTVTLNAETNIYILQWQNDSESYSFRLWLNKDTAKNYNTYFEGIRDSKVTSIKSIGFNQWDEEWELGAINNQGQPVSSTTQIRSKNYINVLPNTSYYFCNKDNTYTIYGFQYDKNYNFIDYINGLNTTITTSSNCAFIKFYVNGHTTYNHDICINISNSSLNGTYKPYTENNLSIPSAIQSLNGYGWGVNESCYNYIDFTINKYIQNVGRIDLGSLNYSILGSGYDTYFVSNTSIDDIVRNTNALCSIYTINNGAYNSMTNMQIRIETNGQITIRNDNYTSTSDFKTAMSGVYLYYELATPVETDISQYIDNNFIEVEENGTITFNNTYNQAVPSEVTYLVEVQ